MLRTVGLTKRFGETVAVHDLDLHVGAGEIYGFLGPNGAGKTTTIHLILGLLPPTAGEVYLFGEPMVGEPLALRRRIGVVAEEQVGGARMTGWEFVRFFADLNRVPRPDTRIERLFHELELWEARDRLVAGYSRGMRQKLSLIRALVQEPELLILDEPVSGLDPYGIRQVRGVIERHRAGGGSVLISSHILSEIERSADRVGILHRGRLLVEDTIGELRRRFQSTTILTLELAAIPNGLEHALGTLPGLERLERAGGRFRLHLSTAEDRRAELFELVVAHGGTLLELRSEEPTLEETFVTITNQNVEQLAGGA